MESPVVGHLRVNDYDTEQADITFPAMGTTTITTTTATATPRNATPLQKPCEYLEDGNVDDIETSVFIGYHLQSLAKANEFLLQFNKESRRSFGVLRRFEAARQVFERRVLG
jgi:hypothetical protein